MEENNIVEGVVDVVVQFLEERTTARVWPERLGGERSMI